MALGNTLSGLFALIMVFAVVGGLIGIGFLVWYLWAMSRLFPRIGLPAGHGWIPIWNDWRLMERTGLPGWIAILYVIPVGSVVAVVFRTIAQHRIGREAGVGAGYTVLGLFIPPLWATLLGSHLRGRVLPDPSTPGVYGAVSTQPPAYARGQAPAATATAFGAAAPQGFGAQAPAPPAPPAGAPSAPSAPAHAAVAPPAPVPPAPTAPPAAASLSPAAPDPWASPAWASAPVPESSGGARPPAGSAPAPEAGPLGRETEAEYARLAAESFQTPPAAPLGPPPPPEPFSWTAASQAQPEQQPAREVPTPPVHPLAAPPEPPAQSAPPAQPAVSAPAPAPAAPPAPVPAQESSAPVPLTLPPAPEEAAGVDPDSSGTGLQEQAAPPVAAVHRSTGITASHRPSVDAAAADDDELDRTVVVPRGPRVGWVIEMPDGEMLAIEHDTVLGRRPEAIDGAGTVAIPDPTRTLSKTHARLRYDGENWTVEDLDSTNGVFLVHADGREEEIAPRTPTGVDSRLMLGTLHIRLRRSDETA